MRPECRAGLLAALLALAAPVWAQPGDARAGKAQFAACASCHQLGPSARHGFGPQLNGLAGRRAGSLAGYAYSPAMKASGLVWTEATLAALLRNPDQLVPGTKMRFWGRALSDRQLADLWAYLATQPGSAAPAPGSPG